MAVCAWSPVSAQTTLDFGQGQPVQVAPSAVLVIDFERAFRESLFGQRAAAEIEKTRQQIAAENNNFTEELDAEEAELTQLRDTIPLDQFRARADAFDEKVQTIRREQDTKARNFARLTETANARFLELARPILTEILVRHDATLLDDRRNYFIVLDQADVTDEAIAEINARIGTGETAETGQQ
ncbi:OmpH family outer membrane protein [Donghicola mangrovi]|uniref:OmpH family outer membrane protein n=1 Tax=Donghicola mangrovi TaxID=2729614 RepID=A0A850Q293_9RHOB|nr:OmpH family outer membrane protein [Donghicola mangrovi]NVO23737.1 OmpH family outer membrane protein [Donghicola mangrovi]